MGGSVGFQDPWGFADRARASLQKGIQDDVEHQIRTAILGKAEVGGIVLNTHAALAYVRYFHVTQK